MPDRVLRASLIGSEKIARVSDQAALLYDRMISIADDFGLLDTSPLSLRLRAVPGRDSYTVERISACCAELVAVGLIRAYVHEGKFYGAICKWDQVRWAKASKCPMPPWGTEHITGGYVAPRARALAVSTELSTAPAAPAHAGNGQSIPLADGTEYAVPAVLVAELERAYPLVDVPATLGELRAWAVANPARRKSARGITRHINIWMQREQAKYAEKT